MKIIRVNVHTSHEQHVSCLQDLGNKEKCYWKGLNGDMVLCH